MSKKTSIKTNAGATSRWPTDEEVVAAVRQLAAGLGDAQRLVVRPSEAWRLLGIGNTTGYGLVAAGELEAIKMGRATGITMRSIRGYVDRRVAASRGKAT